MREIIARFDDENEKPFEYGEEVGELIRCKDCKYFQQGYHLDDWLWCMMNHHYTDEGKYCAWAEREEE